MNCCAGAPRATARPRALVGGVHVLPNEPEPLLANHSELTPLPDRSVRAARPRNCRFQPRHNSGTPAEIAEMVKATGFASVDALIDATVPKAIRRKDGMDLGIYNEGFTESKFLDYFK